MAEIEHIAAFVDALWDADVTPVLERYIAIPNKSPAFDADWADHGHMEAAVELFADWARVHTEGLDGAVVEVIRLEGRTPVIFIEAPGTADGEVLLYGHLDKQPEMTGWSEGLGPWTPVTRGDKLYGRGGADDGYAMFGAIAALLALKSQGRARARCVILIEACEESGSYDLPFYVDHLRARLGSPSLVVCLDSGCGNYDQLWLTTSLRGMIAGDLKAEVLSEGVHSGDASGVVPSSFRILRALLARIEDAADGRILLPALHAPIPQSRVYEAEVAAKSLSDTVWTKFPFLPGMRPVSESLVELVLNRTWRPALAITGASGLPELSNAGNVLRPETALKLSVRLPPTVDADVAAAALKSVLERDPPYGANVSFHAEKSATGWHAPPLAPWLRAAVERASRALFGKEAALMGEGGSIPFMGMLGEAFPEAQFVITGVLGPASNAHGPNEFLHIPTAKRIAAAVALILSDHAVRDAFREAA